MHRILVLLTFACSLPACIVAEEEKISPENQGTLPSVIDSLSESLTSIDTLYCEYRRVMRKGERIENDIQCRYARSGAKWHITEISGKDGSVLHENTVCFDGTKAYSYNAERSPSSSLDFGQIQVRDTHSAPLVSPEYLIGNSISDLNESLLGICRSNANRLSAMDANERGLSSVVVSSIPFGTVEGKPIAYDLTFEIDPSHGFMASRINLEFTSPTMDLFPSHRSRFQRWESTEFRLVKDERTNTNRWFPSKGLLTQGVGDEIPSFELTFETVHLNRALDEHLFNPHVPKGTTILDLTAGSAGKEP